MDNSITRDGGSSSNRKITISTPGPKFLIISRIESTDSLLKVSPFLIKKVVDSTCGGEVAECKKLRNGTILVQTKSLHQANKLIQLKNIKSDIEVDVSLHNSLNYVKGVIYSNDLRGVEEEEILNEIRDQNVYKVEKIRKKVDENMEETGLIILSFGTTTLPPELKIGYERVKIRPYIPLPLRCKNCLHYGHLAKFCKNSKICPNCAKKYHLNIETNEVCTEPKSCLHCNKNNDQYNQHSTVDKRCPIFIKERELQTIITLQKVNKKTAISIYNERNIYSSTNHSFVTRQTTVNSDLVIPYEQNTENNQTKTSLTKTSSKKNTEETISNYSQQINRPIIEYDNSLNSENEDHEMDESLPLSNKKANTISKQKKDILILPRGISNRTRRKIKSKNIAGSSTKPCC